MKLIYQVSDKPPIAKLLVFSLQQLLAIITATIVVPVIVNGALVGSGLEPVLDSAAALVGAGFGTLTYLLFTKFKSPVFLGSSFAFISPLIGACAFGYFGVLVGAAFAAAVYVLIAVIIKFAGTKWVNKLMPPVVIGPTVALIGLSLAGNAVGDLQSISGGAQAGSYNLVAIFIGLFTFFVIVFCSVKGNKTMKLIPFVIGILCGYALAGFFSIFGYACKVEYLKIIDFSALVNNFKPIGITSFLNYPDFTFLHANTNNALTGAGVANIALLYIPVSFVVFAEHIADHKNISSIIEKDLLQDPGLHRTLLGDGIGSLVGSVFGGVPNTTYGESIGCVAITKNASVVSIFGAACMAIVLAFISPVIAFINTIPSCVMGGVCLSLYGFIAVSGLNMIKNVDLGESKNLFVVSSILIAGVGGLSLQFGLATKGQAIITITSIATALIIGIIVNVAFSSKKNADPEAVGDSAASGNAAAARDVADTEAAEEAAAEEEKQAAHDEVFEDTHSKAQDIEDAHQASIEEKQSKE